MSNSPIITHVNADFGQNLAKILAQWTVVVIIISSKVSIIHSHSLYNALFGVCRLGFIFLVFETPLPFSIFKWPTPHSLFFQNDQFLNIYQEILSFSCRMDGCREIPIFGEKNLTAAGVVRKNICYSLPIPKIKFDPSLQGKNALVFIF